MVSKKQNVGAENSQTLT